MAVVNGFVERSGASMEGSLCAHVQFLHGPNESCPSFRVCVPRKARKQKCGSFDREGCRARRKRQRKGRARAQPGRSIFSTISLRRSAEIQEGPWFVKFILLHNSSYVQVL